MARPWPPIAMLVLLALAGCTRPASGNEEDGLPTTTTPTNDSKVTTTTPPAGEEVVLAGALERLTDGWVVNVSSYNAGGGTFGHARYPFDNSHQPAWSATLSGPPGHDLVYAGPQQYETSYPTYTNQPMPPSSYVNWTYAGSSVAGCYHRPACANTWNGNLTVDGQRSPAPPGEYTWRFTFRYSPDPSRSQAWVDKHIDFKVEVAPVP